MDAACTSSCSPAPGEKFFCAGANIGMLKDADPAFKYYFCLHANETLNRLEQTPKLVIAALNGHTVGGGLEVAMAADIRIARQGGGKIGLPEVALGVLPGTGGTQRLARLVGKARAIELMVTGTLFSFEEAAALGLVNHVWGEADLNGRTFAAPVLDYAQQFTPPHRASKAVGHIKRAVQSGLRDELPRRRWRSSASCSSGCSSPMTRRKASAPTSRSASRTVQEPSVVGLVWRKTIAVLGAGTMGHGIAHAAMAAGYETRLYDVSQAQLDMADGRSSPQSCRRASTSGKLPRTIATRCCDRLRRHDQHRRRRARAPTS